MYMSTKRPKVRRDKKEKKYRPSNQHLVYVTPRSVTLSNILTQQNALESKNPAKGGGEKGKRITGMNE